MQSNLVKGLAAGTLALALAASSIASAEPLAAGTTVPAISVTDQIGTAHNLASLTAEKKGVVLVFTRSLSW